MARTSSLNCLSCRNPYQTPHSLNPSPLFTENPFFFTEKCFVGSPAQKSALIVTVGGSQAKLWGNPRRIAGKFFPESRNATNSRISGTGKGKPAGNLGSTLPGPCLHLLHKGFFEIDSSSLLELFLNDPRPPLVV